MRPFLWDLNWWIWGGAMMKNIYSIFIIHFAHYIFHIIIFWMTPKFLSQILFLAPVNLIYFHSKFFSFLRSPILVTSYFLTSFRWGAQPSHAVSYNISKFLISKNYILYQTTLFTSFNHDTPIFINIKMRKKTCSEIFTTAK